jgi:hypothetical protein
MESEVAVIDVGRCFGEIVKRLMREDRDLCRVELLAWFDRVLRRRRRRYKLLYRQFRELLPYALGLMRHDGTLMIDCNEKRICNEPALCLKAYLVCRKRWMKKALEKLAPGTPYAEVARVVLGEDDVHDECGGPPCGGAGRDAYANTYQDQRDATPPKGLKGEC